MTGNDRDPDGSHERQSHRDSDHLTDSGAPSTAPLGVVADVDDALDADTWGVVQDHLDEHPGRAV